MFSGLKKQFSSLKNGRPGRRFVDHYERRHKQNGKKAPWQRFATLALGVGLLVVGVFFSVAPAIPGFVLVLPALGILVSEIKLLAVWLDRAEVLIRGFIARIQAARKSS